MTQLLDEAQVREMLRQEVNQAGGQQAFARFHGVSTGNLSNTLQGKRPVTPQLAAAIGLRPVVAFDRMPPDDSECHA